MTKLIVKLDVQDEKHKQKAMNSVSSLSGVNTISMDMKEKKLTVTGEVDPMVVVTKLRKICHTQIVSVGPQKPEPKKEDPKKKEEEQKIADFIKANWQAYNNLYSHPYPPPTCLSIEEDPNACVIS